MPEPVERGRHSVLYNYGVGKVFFHEKSRLVERVTAIQQAPETPTPPVNRQQIKARLKTELARYARADLDPDQVRDVRVNALQPDWVVAAASPAAFYCQKCGHLYIAAKPARRGREHPLAALAAAYPRDGKCTCQGAQGRCNGRVVQYNILTTHNCGDEVFVPGERGLGACRDHATTHLHWLRQGSERAARWRIRCMMQNCPHVREAHQSFFAKHWQCPLDDVDRAGRPILENREKSWFSAPFMKATHYMARTINLLNSDNSLPDLVPGTDDALVATLGALRDAASFQSYDPAAGLEGWRAQRAATGGADASALQARRDEREAIAASLPPGPTRDSLLQRFDDEIRALERAGGPALDLASVAAVAQKQDFARQIRDTVLYMEHRRGFDLGWLQRQSADDPEYARQVADAQAATAPLGISDMRYQDRIPLTTALIGYTRGSYEARKAQLKLFMPRGFDGGVDVFVHHTTTEGIWVQLDPARTLSWLAARCRAQAPAANDFPHALHALQQLYQPEAFDSFGSCSDEWTGNHYALLHTVSHLLIKAAGRLTGLEQEGISEEILPFSNSFLIYANHSGEFVLGGLQLMMQYHMATVLRSLREEAYKCVYSPVCEGNKWACHGCVHVGEVSCGNFNRTLARKVLIDSEGFWVNP